MNPLFNQLGGGNAQLPNGMSDFQKMMKQFQQLNQLQQAATMFQSLLGG